MARVTSTTVPPALNAYFSRKLLRRALPLLLHGKFAQRRELPSNSTKTIKFRKYPSLDITSSLAPLAEGVPNDPISMLYSEVQATVRQNGGFIELTDLVTVVNESPILQEANKLLAEHMAQVMDTLFRDTFTGGTVVHFGGEDLDPTIDTRAEVGRDIAGGKTDGTGSMVSPALIARMIRTLDNANASMYTKIVRPGSGQDSHPLRPAYWVITHPNVAFSLPDLLPGYISIEKYATTADVIEGEVGAYRNARFLSSTFAKIFPGAGGDPTTNGVRVTGNNCDVYTLLMLAEDALGIVPLNELTVEQIIQPRGSAGTADPYKQISTTSWIRTGTQLILQDSFMARAEVTAAL
jgi:N4-gp56 family major capsid protein